MPASYGLAAVESMAVVGILPVVEQEEEEEEEEEEEGLPFQ